MEDFKSNKGTQFVKKYPEESIYFTYRDTWYTGKYPTYYDSYEFRFTKDFENNFELIKQEFDNFFSTSNKQIKTFYIPHDFTVDGWKILTIWGYLNHKIRILKRFPTIKKLLKKYPEIISMQISILQPGTRINAHFGGSNALVRHHLALYVPGTYPELGFNLKGNKRAWTEGKLLSFCESHRHYVWNYTNQKRVVLMFDTIHPQYKKRKYWILAGVTSILMMVIALKKLPFLNKASHRSEVFAHRILSAIILPLFIVRDIVKRLFI